MDTDQAMKAIGDRKIEVFEDRYQTLDELKRSASISCDNARNAVNQLADAESYRRFREMTADLEREYLKSLRKCEQDMRKETKAIGDLISQSMTTVRLLAQEEKKYANLRGELKYVTESFMTLQKKWLPSLTELDE